MRSGGVVGLVQEKAACNRLPAPIRNPQPLSRLRRQLPLHRGAKPRGDGRPGVCPFSPGQKKTAVGRQRRGGRSALFPQQRPRSGAGPVICPAGGAGKRSCQRRSRRIGRTGSRSRRRFGAFSWSAGPARPTGPEAPGSQPFPWRSEQTGQMEHAAGAEPGHGALQ